MKTILALGLLVLLTGLFVVPAYASLTSKYLELLEVNEAVDEYGLMTFAGTVQNTHTTQPIGPVTAYVILKLEGRIIAIYDPSVSPADGGGIFLDPGETGTFFVESDYAEGDYDEFSLRLEGSLRPPDESLVVGELIVIEESLNRAYDPYGTHVVYGELFNNTNAVIGRVTLKIVLLDVRGDPIGLADYFSLDELWPGQTVDFTARITSFISGKEVDGWTVVMEFQAVRLVEPDVPTASTGITWGQIKNHNRAESAD